MKQIIEDLKNGKILLEDVPAPIASKGHVLIQTRRSLVSLGTEKMLVEFGKASLVSKARQQPEKVAQVLDKIKTEGLLPTLEAVFRKLNQPMPLGYCNVGEVIGVGEGVLDIKIGDRVASNGPHAEVVNIPKSLCVRIPDTVCDEDAAFTVIGSIGLQGIRLADPAFGETVVVIGLGLVGLMTAELLAANGCIVVGFDVDGSKINAARQQGITAFNSSSLDAVKTVEELTGGNGADAVLITASTSSDEVISQAARMSRKRGKIVLIGVVGLKIQRADFYKKELSFQVSCSYGPGRYDDDYEQRGHDYPLPFVRWTERRNFETILNAIAAKKIDVNSLITERVPLENYSTIYDAMNNSASIASILVYPQISSRDVSAATVSVTPRVTRPGKGSIGIIGAGNFTKMVVLPELKKLFADLKYISSAGGVSAKDLAKKYDVELCTTDYREILKDESVGLVIITTRHNLHSAMSIEALQAGKNVFVEKPLAINAEELEQVIAAYGHQQNTKTITVGFNRRFSPFIQKAKQLLTDNQAPVNMHATINAGFIPAESWVQDMSVGGGRVIGEACHFIDLMSYLSGALATEVFMNCLGTHPLQNTDNVIISLKFSNGSQGSINYFSNGHKAYAKERIEIYSQGKILVVDNFRKLEGYGFKGFSSLRGRQDKGHRNQFKELLTAVQHGGAASIPFDSLVNTTRTTFAAIESLMTGMPKRIA